jgi:hypothetical protein
MNNKDTNGYRSSHNHASTLRVLAVATAIIAAYWLLSTVQQVPAQSCQVNGLDQGYQTTFNQCEGK